MQRCFPILQFKRIVEHAKDTMGIHVPMNSFDEYKTHVHVLDDY
jgi:hypothetical protein